jgi:hypothetical protein
MLLQVLGLSWAFLRGKLAASGRTKNGRYFKRSFALGSFDDKTTVDEADACG